MSHLLGTDEYDRLHERLRSWGATVEQAIHTLEDATFGAGMIGMHMGVATRGTPIGIRVDDRADLHRALTHVGYSAPRPGLDRAHRRARR